MLALVLVFLMIPSEGGEINTLGLVPDNATCERIYGELSKRRNNSQQYFVSSIEAVRQDIKKISQKEATLYEDRLCGPTRP